MMKKTLYIIFAILIATGLTAVQILISRAAANKNETTVCIAAADLTKGSVIDDESLKEVIMMCDDSQSLPSPIYAVDLIGKTVSYNISEGEYVTSSDARDNPMYEGGERYVSLKVNGGNSNAGCINKGDVVDVFFIPDMENLENYHIVWLNEVLVGFSRFIKGKTPGILFENLTVNHIERTAGQQAEYISLCVPKPVDEAMAFLEQVSVYEIIGR